MARKKTFAQIKRLYNTVSGAKIKVKLPKAKARSFKPKKINWGKLTYR